ncbi:MAG: glycosyltransferase family 2 protein [Candidatus Brockarchaeota archaeon]|nr:glycosyltransferase family 2 protein [Candidatus Brockarchaeota archaeon]
MSVPVITPNLLPEKGLTELFDCLLMQTYKPFEVIVVGILLMMSLRIFVKK